uniref:exodeoxyribonuclease VII large subunit n=1 Tax=Roseobacter sp. TaxID=1907202 RepID=UPI0025FCD2BE
DRKRLADRAVRLAPALMRTVSVKKDRFATQLRRFRPDAFARENSRKERQLRDLATRLSDAGQRQIAAWRRKIDSAERLRRTLGYEATLERGFAVVRSEGSVVTQSKVAEKAQRLEIQFADGRVTLDKGTSGGGAPRKAARKSKAPGQGSLF